MFEEVILCVRVCVSAHTVVCSDRAIPARMAAGDPGACVPGGVPAAHHERGQVQRHLLGRTHRGRDCQVRSR